MGFQHAYCTSNLLTGLAATAFSWSSGDTTNRSFLNDGRMDQVFAASSQNGVSSGDAITLTTTFSGAVSPSVAAILNSNIASAPGTPVIRVRYSDDGVNWFIAKSATTPNATFPRDREHALQFPPSAHVYWQIGWNWQNGSAFALTLGEVWFGVSTQPQRYVIYGGHEEGFLPQVEQFDGYTGEIRQLSKGTALRQKTLNWKDLAQSERDDFTGLVKSAASGANQLLWMEQYDSGSSAATNDQQDCIYGVLDAKSPWSWKETDFGRYDMSPFVIRSKARDVGH